MLILLHCLFKIFFPVPSYVKFIVDVTIRIHKEVFGVETCCCYKFREAYVKHEEMKKSFRNRKEQSFYILYNIVTAGFQGIYVWNKAVRDNGRKFHCYLWLMLQFKTIYLCICGKVPQNFSTNIHVDGKITKCFFSICHSCPVES